MSDDTTDEVEILVDLELLDSFGLGDESIYSTKGKLLPRKFNEVLMAMASDQVNFKTKDKIASQLQVWISTTTSELKKKTLIDGAENLCAWLTNAILKTDDDGIKNYDYYCGEQKWVNTVTSALSVACMTEQKIAVVIAPFAFNIVEKVLNSDLLLQEESHYVKCCASTQRQESCRNLLGTCPYQGNVDIPNAFSVLKRILLSSDDLSALKNQAKSTLSYMPMVNKNCMKYAGKDLIELIIQGEYHDLIYNFSTLPEMYTNTPDALHDHIDFLLAEFPYLNVSGIFYNISKKHPEALVPYTNQIVEKLETDSMSASLTLMMLAEMAAASPESMYPHVNFILAHGRAVSSGEYSLAAILGNVGKVSEPPGVADEMFIHLLELLNSTDTNVLLTVLMQISNIKTLLTSISVLQKNIPLISKHKTSQELVVTEIEDYAAGISLRNVNERVVAIEEKIAELNRKVAESCFSFDDVVAYVDANIADVKDFVGEVVKKLPTPKRLEVVGTLRKTLLLHFECAHTGREFAVESHEWSKWLKMGFSLIKSGKAIIDIGMGNPLALLSTGINLVSEIYTHYKTNDDDEFNTYITNPFLTSSEQDMLIEKLRKQHFFDKFAYDSQIGGWYLLHPTKDGTAPAGDAGTVTKVRTKEGYGIGETVKATVKSAVGVFVENADDGGGGDGGEEDAGMDVAATAVELEGDAETLLELGNEVCEDESVRDSEKVDSQRGSEGVGSGPVKAKGGRGARAKMVLRGSKVAPDPSTDVFVVPSYGDQLRQLEDRVSVLEKKNIELMGELRKAQNSGCTIC